MCKIVSQIMEREVSNQVPLLVVGLTFQCPEPVMNARLCQLGVPLQGENIRAALITSPMAKIVIEGTPRLVEEVDITEFLSLMPNM